MKTAQSRSAVPRNEQLLAVRCLCGILANHFQFNFAETLCKAVAPFVFSSYPLDETPIQG